MSQSVVGLISLEGKNKIAQAQTVAIANNLPLAVVYCMESWQPEILDRLRPIEAKLAAKNVPLMVLLGKADKTLAGFIYHTHPIEVFYDVGFDLSKVIQHPHDWPGRVITIDELTELYQAGQVSC